MPAPHDPIDQLREIARRSPQHTNAHVGLLVALVGADRRTEARDHLVELIREHPTWAQLHFDVLTLSYQADAMNVGVFLSSCQDAAAERPDDDVLTYLAGVCQHARGVPVFGMGLSPKDLSDVLARYERVIKLNPRFAAAHFHAGIAAYTQRNVDRAAAAARAAIAAAPRMAEPHFLLGTIHKVQGRTAEAVQCFEAFLERAEPYLQQYVQAARNVIGMLKS